MVINRYTNLRIQVTKQPDFPHILRLYPKMVIRAAQIYLNKPGVNEGWITAVARDGATNTGLIVALWNSRTATLQIISWYVRSEHANQGIGGSLLQELERWCGKQGVRRIGLDFRDGQASFNVVKHILRKNAWGQPQPVVYRFKIAAGTLQALQWDKYQLPARMTLFPWKELTENQKTRLMDEYRNNEQLPSELSPFHLEDGLEQCVSLGIRRGGDVIGWIIAHRPGVELIEYSMLYVKPAYRKSGVAIFLLGESFKRLPGTGASKVIFQVRASNASMLRFTQKRFRPLLSQATLYRIHKEIG